VKKFHLTILGSNAACPAYGRITSCQILNYDESLILIDCGEGCQIRLAEYKIKKSKIDIICISHLHGDHVFGLPGLVSSFSHEGRSKDLTIIGPLGIKQFVESTLRLTHSRQTYKIEFIELDHIGNLTLAQKPMTISAFPLKHRVPTYGYRFDESLNERNINKKAISTYNLTIEELKKLKKGIDVIRVDGQIISSEEATLKQKPPRSFAYCSDTIYDEELIEYVKEVNFLYLETTYMHDLVELAIERMHSTSTQSAMLAKKAGVGNLIIGHYSSRYRSVDDLWLEAKNTFNNTIKGYDGLLLDLN